jgi:hypothetical protein
MVLCLCVHHQATFKSAQVDIFSLGVICFELFSMNLLAIMVHKSGLPDEFENYAKRVANGHREGLRTSWPQELKVSCRS